jgi:hypothetical protein
MLLSIFLCAILTNIFKLLQRMCYIKLDQNIKEHASLSKIQFKLFP